MRTEMTILRAPLLACLAGLELLNRQRHQSARHSPSNTIDRVQRFDFCQQQRRTFVGALYIHKRVFMTSFTKIVFMRLRFWKRNSPICTRLCYKRIDNIAKSSSVLARSLFGRQSFGFTSMTTLECRPEAMFINNTHLTFVIRLLAGLNVIHESVYHLRMRNMLPRLLLLFCSEYSVHP